MSAPMLVVASPSADVFSVSAALEPTSEQIQALVARPADEPVVMVNLLQFREAGERATCATPRKSVRT